MYKISAAKDLFYCDIANFTLIEDWFLQQYLLFSNNTAL